MALTDSLQAFWELGNVSDAHGANTLTNNNTVTFVAGKVGNAANFVAASSQSLSITDNAPLSMGNIDFTIAFWAYITTKNGAGDLRPLIVKWTSAGNQREYLIDHDTDTDRFRFTVSPDGSAQTSKAADNLGSPSITTWYFLVCWHDATGNTINIQVNNGTADSGAHTTGVFDGTATFQMGDLNAGSWHDGRLDQVGVWKRVLTTDEKTWLYNAGAGRTYAEVLTGMDGVSVLMPQILV